MARHSTASHSYILDDAIEGDQRFDCSGDVEGVSEVAGGVGDARQAVGRIDGENCANIASAAAQRDSAPHIHALDVPAAHDQPRSTTSKREANHRGKIIEQQI